MGLVLGAVGSVPVAGPISVLVLRRGLAARIGEARAVVGGAALAEGGHAYLALRGLSWTAARWPQAFAVSQIVGAAVLILVGGWLFFHPIPAAVGPEGLPPPDPSTHGIGRVLSRGGRGNARHFALGLGLTGLNLSILLNWTAILGTVARFGYQPIGGVDIVLFAVGVAIGIALWFEVALRVLTRYRAHFPAGIVRWCTRLVGLLLVALGAVAIFARGR